MIFYNNSQEWSIGKSMDYQVNQLCHCSHCHNFTRRRVQQAGSLLIYNYIPPESLNSFIPLQSKMDIN